jgi:GNAT superfamily N-acetyltransferase
MAVAQATLMRLSRLEPHIAFIAVKPAVVPAEWRACRDMIREICLHEGWGEVDEFLEIYANPGKSILWYSATLQADVMGAVMLVERLFPMIHLTGGWPSLQVKGEKPAEVSIIAVRREYRLQGVDLALLRQIETYSREMEITDWYAIFDDRRLAFYNGIGLPFQEVPESEGGGRHLFWGEECFPARLNRHEGEEYVRKYAPILWKILANREEGT